MSDREKAHELCEITHHQWSEDYYGYTCQNCGEFIPYGCEPWTPVDQDDDDDFGVFEWEQEGWAE
jgi:hypothetical protein